MMRNAFIHPVPEDTSQRKTWMSPNDYFQSLANSRPVIEDSTIFPGDGFPQSGFNRTAMAHNNSRMNAPPQWTSQTPDWQADPGYRRHVENNVGMPDFPTRIQAPSFLWMENGAVNPYSANSHGTVIPGSTTNEYLTIFENQSGQVPSEPSSKPQIKPVDETRNSTDGRSTQPGHQGTESEYVRPQ
jgi:hypothetical protein